MTYALLPDVEHLMCAFHESGHAAVHDAFGHPITRVTIDGAGRTEGGRVRSGFLEYCIPLLAGHAAHERFCATYGLPFPAAAREAENSTDIAKFDRALLDVDEAARADVRRFVWALTEDAVNTVWPKISLLAAMLLAHGTVSGADLPLTAERRFDLTAFTDDAPVIWWRLDESETFVNDSGLVAKNYGTLGTAGDGTYLGPPRFQAQGMVVKDPAPSIEGISSLAGFGGEVAMGATIDSSDFDLFDEAPFVLEGWFFPGVGGGAAVGYAFQYGTGFTLEVFHNPATETWNFSTQNNVASLFDVTDGGTSPPFKRYHVVCKFVAGEALKLWVNGTQFSGDTPSGTFTTGQDFYVGTANSAATNWHGRISHAAVYTGAAAEAVDQAWVTDHYNAGIAPWNGDQPEDRADRVFDLVGWPEDLREIDAGNVALQSAELGTTALEHMQKIAETEFGLLFTSRDGKVRFISRANQFARQPKLAIFGDADDGVEIPYRDIKFDDGDATIRNRATISRLNGVAQVSESTASVDEYGRFDYKLDGLLHSAEAHSSSYADFIVAEYAQPRRRVVGLELGPMKTAAGWAALMDLELADSVTIRNRPLPASSTLFEQTCVIEGIECSWTPDGQRTARLTLSPEFSTSF